MHRLRDVLAQEMSGDSPSNLWYADTGEERADKPGLLHTKTQGRPVEDQYREWVGRGT